MDTNNTHSSYTQSNTDHNESHSRSPPQPSSPTPTRDPDPQPPVENLHVELQTQLDLTDENPGEAVVEEKDWDGWEDYEDENNGEDRNNDDENVTSDEKNERQNGYRWHNQQHQYYPLRPDSEDCAFYIKTGSCKFGANCKFNHPLTRRNQAAKEKSKDGEDGRDKPRQAECKFYLRSGGCKFGKACKYNHSRAKAMLFPSKPSVFPALELNFLGLPIRLGEKECPFYMRNGSCKYGANCRFNHPNPIAAGGGDPPASFGNGVSTLHVSSPPSVTSWSSPKAVREPAPYVPIVFPPTQVAPSRAAEWNGYQAPIYPLERSMIPPPAYVINNPTIEPNVYGHQRQQILGVEFPERPGQPECSYFMKTGDCKFKSNCKYHHPKTRISKSPPCAVSDKGLPLRPDQNVCSHYSRYGICKFGPACRFDHPIHLVSETVSGDNQSTTFDNSEAIGDVRPAESGNATNNGIQQPV